VPITSERVKHFTESVIREMTRVSMACDSINLSQGFPDFDPPAELVQAAHQALDQGHHQYAITWGALSLRQALARKQSHWMGLDLDPDENFVVTCGSTEAMIVSMMTLCNPGDKVIVFSPFYENYGADAILSGAEPIYVPLSPPDFGFDPDELRRAFQQGVKALILCNPSNPTGKVFTPEELKFIADLAVEYDAYVITDEVYEHIVFDPYQHTYIASLPGMFERTLSCSSLSKTYSITGWRLGYMIGPGEIIRQARKVHDFLTVGAPAPLQEAAAKAVDFPLSYYDELKADYTAKRDCFLGYLREAGLKFTEPQGAYYVLVDFSEYGVEDDMDFAKFLAREIGVSGVPGSSFFRESVNHLIRFHFAKNENTLKAAGERLLKMKEGIDYQKGRY
jgi:aspartate/methionine/tyrosine aminotransferase